jgi:hypothetical protein
MTKNSQKTNQVSVCHKNSCVHAAGENAKMITMGAALMLVLIGIAALLRSA